MKINNHLATKLFLKLSHKPDMDFAKSFPQSVRDMDDDSLPAPSNIYLSAAEKKTRYHMSQAT